MMMEPFGVNVPSEHVMSFGVLRISPRSGLNNLSD